MQKLIIFLILAMFFTVSCGDSNKTENDADPQDNDSVDENTDAIDSEISDDDDEQSDEDSDITEKEDEDIDSSSTSQAKYNSPYGSVSFDFSGYIGSRSYPWDESGFLFSGTYGNESTPILPEDLEDVVNPTYTTDADYYPDDIRDKYIVIQRIEYFSENPMVSFYIPIKIASKEGVYNINYDYKDNVSLLIFEVDWNSGTGKCIHAFAEGEIEITKIFIDGEYELSFRGDAKLYNPLNYKGNDISSIPSISEFLIKLSGTDEICDPVD